MKKIIVRPNTWDMALVWNTELLLWCHSSKYNKSKREMISVKGQWKFSVNDKQLFQRDNSVVCKRKLYESFLFKLGGVQICLYLLNPFQPSVSFYIETSHLICTAMLETIFKWVSLFSRGLKKFWILWNSSFSNI